MIINFRVNGRVKTTLDSFETWEELHEICNLLAYENKADLVHVCIYKKPGEALYISFLRFYDESSMFTSQVNYFQRSDWKGDFGKDCKIGSAIDEKIIDEFINVLPPVTLTGLLVQPGEAQYTSVEGRQTYTTFEKKHGFWFFIGYCHAGSNNPVESINYN